MNAPKCHPEDSLKFLVASPRVVRGTEAARVQPERAKRPAHDAFTRLRQRLAPAPATLWAEADRQLRRDHGVLVLDASTLDKRYARTIGLLTRHWSGTHRRVVQGRNPLTLLWTDGEALSPGDYRRYEESVDGLRKNDHFRALLDAARARGCAPECVVFARWYASLANRNASRAPGWRRVTRLHANRLANPDGAGDRPLGDCAIAAGGTRVHRQGDGCIPVFLLGHPDGDKGYWATSAVQMAPPTRLNYGARAWGREVDHRGRKQHCGVERAEGRAARAQRNHSNGALRASLRLEQHRLVTGVRWWEANMTIIRAAIRRYLAHPRYTLTATAEATA